MRQLLRLVIRLYPRSWRARYGDEMGALLSDMSPRWTDAADLALSALAMRLRQAHAAKLALTLMLGCTLAALGYARWQAPLYESAAEFVAQADGEATRAVLQRVLSRRVLEPVMDAHQLYAGRDRAERLERFRRDIRVGAIHNSAWQLSFMHDNAATARAVAERLAEELSREGLHLSKGASESAPRRMLYGRFGIRGLLVGIALALCMTFARRFVTTT